MTKQEYVQSPEHAFTTLQQPNGQQYMQEQPRQFQNATTLNALSRAPAPVDCPSCGERAVTEVEYKTGSSTHLWAAGLCFCLGLGCIPYLIKSLKDVVHKCGNCGTTLATWHRSGGTEVHRFH